MLAVGPGKLLDNGKRAAIGVKVGDEVIYGKYAGTDIEVDGEEIKILRESDILAKIVKLKRSRPRPQDRSPTTASSSVVVSPRRRHLKR